MAVSSPGRLHSSEASSMRKSLGEFLVFLAVEKGASSNTIAAYKNDLQQLADYIGPRGGRNGWQTLSRPHIQAFILDLKQRGYTETSVARKVAALRSFFAFLAAEGHLANNPTEGLTPPRVGKTLPKAITPNEVDELLEAPAPRSPRAGGRGGKAPPSRSTPPPSRPSTPTSRTAGRFSSRTAASRRCSSTGAASVSPGRASGSSSRATPGPRT